MKLMKMIVPNDFGKPRTEMWLNPAQITNVYPRQKDGRVVGSLVWSGEYNFNVEEPPEEVARLFEEATR